MRSGWSVVAVVCALFCATPSLAQDLSSRLEADSMGTIVPGTYLAGDTIKFSLDRYGDKYLMRIGGDPEVYVLYPDRASVGGRILKYDSGATVISVAGWGGMTFYTDSKPGGLPASRTGDSSPPVLAPVSQNDIESAADDESAHLAYTRKLHISVKVDWSDVADDSRQRALAFDTIENTVRGIDRFSLNGSARAALAAKVDTLKFDVTASRPTADLNGKTLTVTFNRNQGYAGRASSRAIARALGTLLHVKVAN